MGKKYVVDGATLSCSLGVCKTKLIVPAHRHIYMTGKRMANKLDVNLIEHCIGSFGFCRRSSPPPVCTFNILLPWQDTQEDVFGAKQDGVLETSWTCCIFGGKIKVVETGQGAGSADAALKNIQELEKCAAQLSFGDGIENLGGYVAHYLFPELMEEQKGEAPWKRSSEAYAYNTTDEHIEQIRKTINHNYEEEKKKRVSDSMKKNKK